ncbi:MAG: archaeosortase/exosortase family protein [Candidatus Bathyarchaeia archaeon]
MSDRYAKLAEREVYQKIIVVAAVTFVILPFVTTFNEFLTKVVESLRFVSLIQSLVAPFIVRVVAVILQMIEVPVSFDGSFLYLTGGWMPLRIYINWNCIGWQSFILLALTFVTGLQGRYTHRSRLVAILTGLEGTFLINVVRILIPTILAYHTGYIPAIIFHDYMGTVFTLLWLGVFWNFAFQSILVKAEGFELYEEISIQGEVGTLESGQGVGSGTKRGDV